MKYTDKQGTQTYTHLYHQETAIPQLWQYVCVNLNELAMANIYLWGKRQTGSIMCVKNIYISGHVMVDDVWIGSAPVSGKWLSCGLSVFNWGRLYKKVIKVNYS